MYEKGSPDKIKTPPQVYDGMPCLVCGEGYYRATGRYDFTCDHCSIHWHITPADPLVD